MKRSSSPADTFFEVLRARDELPATCVGENPQRDLPGKLIAFDLRRDVGLVAMQPGVPVVAAKVGGAGDQPRKGDAVFSMGCNQGKPPTVIANQVLAVNRYHGPANLVVGGRPIDGRSGGGLFDQEGVLVGVCCAADQEADEGLYSALGPIHAELDRSGLGFIYRKPGSKASRKSAIDCRRFGRRAHRQRDFAANGAPIATSGSECFVGHQPAPGSCGIFGPDCGNRPHRRSSHVIDHRIDLHFAESQPARSRWPGVCHRSSV